MREFRIFDKTKNKYRDVVEIRLDTKTIIVHKDKDDPDYGMIGELLHFEDVVFEQFTGLKDKNGTKIYEGDICQIRISREHGHVADGLAILGSVEFGRITIANNSLYTFDAFHIKGRSIEYELAYKLEIIGNIHENPYLLKE